MGALNGKDDFDSSPHQWTDYARRQQLLTLWKRYREADDYNRPAVKLLLRNVMDGFNGER
jgi:hypothetical protein